MAEGLEQLLDTHQAALRLREQRQAILASNIANVDTPNYKARDINFSAVLKQAIGDTKTQQPVQAVAGALPLAVTSNAHLPSKNAISNGAGASVEVQFRNDQQGRIDGNNVDGDYERMQLMENAMNYEALVTLATGKIRGMLAVIQG